MSDFLESSLVRPRPEPDQARTLEMLATLFVVVLVVTTLYVGREIFIPIAIAIPVSFVLSPPVLLLRRWGLGRVPSVLTVVLAALVIAFSVSAVLTRQVSELAVDLPLYQATINAKLDDLRVAAADNALFAKVSAALKKLGDEFRAGMVFAFNIDLFDPTFHDGKTGCVFAETVVITETGARRLHDYPTEFQTIPI